MSAEATAIDRSWLPLFYVTDKQVVIDVFRCALGHRQLATRMEREAMNEAVRKLRETFNGFRACNAPSDRLAPPLTSLCVRDEDVRNSIVPIILRWWWAERPDLRKRVVEGLRVRDLEVSEDQRGLCCDWSSTEFSQLVSTLAGDIGEAEGLAILAVCVLTGRAPASKDNEEEEEDDHLYSLVEFEDWLEALGELHPEAPEWDGLESFITRARTLADAALHRRQSEAVFTQFHEQGEKLSKHFDIDIEGCNASSFTEDRLAAVTARIRDILADLGAFDVPVPVSFRERVPFFERQTQAGERITAAWIEITQWLIRPVELESESARIAHPNSTPEPDAKQQAASNEDENSEPVDANEVVEPPVPEQAVDPQPSPADFSGDADGPTGPTIETSEHLEAGVALPAEPPPSPMNNMANHVWRLVGDRRFGVAAALSRCMAEVMPQYPRVPDWLLEAVVLAGNITSESGETAVRLASAFSRFEQPSGGSSDPVRLLLFAAAARPAVIAPRTGAGAVLRCVGIPELHTLANALAEFSERLVPLDATVLLEMRGEAARRHAVEEIRGKARTWLHHASTGVLTYAPATFVLRKWVEPGQFLYRLLKPVEDDAVGRAPEVASVSGQLSSSKEIRRLIEHTDRSVLQRRVGKSILGNALEQLEERVQEAAALARAWLSFQRPNSTNSTRYQIETADRLRRSMEACLPSVADYLQSQLRQNRRSETGCAASCCESAIEDLRCLFDTARTFTFTERDPDLLLNGDLLRARGLSFDETWSPDPSSPHERLNALQDFILNAAPEWSEAFVRLCDKGDHLGTARLIEYLEVVDPAADLQELTSRRQEALTETRKSVLRRIEQVRRKIDNAVAMSHLSDAQGQRCVGIVETTAEEVPEALAFHRHIARLDEIEAIIQTNRDNETESVRQRLHQVASDHPDRERIVRLLDSGDVVTANDYIEIIRNGGRLPSQEGIERDAFHEFFPDRLQKLQRTLADENPTQLIRTVRQGKNFCDIDMSRVVGAQHKSAAEMLEAWFYIKRQQDINEKAGRTLLDGLGFNVLGLRIGRQGRRVWLDVTTDTIQDRDRCPLPMFGSEARGEYRVMCVWARPTEEDLISDIGDTAHGRATLVFYFGRMSETRRRDLARQSIRQRRSFVLLDDTLLMFLCGERGSRLPVLFSCSLPFTWAEPYTTTAGLLAPEMLYGRERERDSVINPFGSCFIYGGRQLGKTVLLRDVERRVHNPETGRIALWIDLKAKGIGYDRPVDDIWTVLSTEFRALGVLPAAAHVHVSPDRLFDHVQRWLSGDNSRRILLLLDEADRFLDIDGRSRTAGNGIQGEFSRTARLKGVMEATSRRFKVVFAGLHNVQRTTQLENHPLAHYGEPLCIGPLIEGADRRAACDLVTVPLGALGYRFESPDLVMRLAAQANYYPSLIQLYCNQLLQHVTARSQSGPPYVLTSRHLEELHESRELQRAIRDRLFWTLQLDERYEVVANIITLNYLYDKERGIVEGIPVSTIRRDALTCWPEEFQKISSERAFEVLLEEMVGLGVLRVAERGHYTLRSPNVLLLMGNENDVLAALTRKREPVAEYEAGAFRAAHQKQPLKRSCLTAHQEGQLKSRSHSVLAVFGVQGAGLDDLQDSAERLFGAGGIIDCADVVGLGAFQQKLGELDRRPSDTHTLLLVPASCSWSETWVKEAVRKTEKLTSKRAFVTVLFVGDPAAAWQWAEARQTINERFRAMNVTVLTLERWKDSMVRQWLDDCGFQSMPEFRTKLEAVTGYWSILLYEIHRLLEARGGGVQEREAVLDLYSAGISVDAKVFGLDVPQPAESIAAMATLDGAVTAADLAQLADIDVNRVQAAISWADALGLVRSPGEDRWELDPTVSKTLRDRAIALYV